jgi:hypothetical protein
MLGGLAGTPRTLTQRDLNRALLARQLLLERRRTSVPRALERIGGIQAQHAPSMYIGLWSRLAGFERDVLTRALERRTVVQGTMMRSTIHLVSAADYWPLTAAIRRRRLEEWVKSKHRPDRPELARAAKKLERPLAEGPLRAADAKQIVGGGPWLGGVGMLVDLLRVPPSGTWEHRRADLYATAESWPGPQPRLKPDDAMVHLVRRYLTGFGPSSRAEIADWAGVKKADVDPALDRIRPRRFVAEDGEELVDLPRAPLPAADTPAPVRFLPVWDATLLVHKRRAGILSEEHRPVVFNTRTPHSVNTFLVDGVVAGTWRHERDRVELEPFGKLPRMAQRELRDEAARLAELHA